MRKMILIVLLTVVVLLAKAGEYGYLVFTNTSGATTALTVNNLSATVNGTSLVVTNDDGMVNFALTELASMQFSVDGESLSALENVLDGDRPVQAYSIGGTSLGMFENLVQAAQQLAAGGYVISNGRNSIKVKIER